MKKIFFRGLDKSTENFGEGITEEGQPMTEIRIIDESHKSDINIPNEPFLLVGKMILSYVNEQWDYEVRYFEEADRTEMCFPDENYDYDKMKKDCVFVGAYENGRCVGVAILQDAWFKYMYLYDLKVSREYRRKGVAAALVRKAKEICKARNYAGIYTLGQDNNLAACLFYIETGFHIGGLDTNVYQGTNQEGKADIVFYLDC